MAVDCGGAVRSSLADLIWQIGSLRAERSALKQELSKNEEQRFRLLAQIAKLDEQIALAREASVASAVPD